MWKKFCLRIKPGTARNHKTTSGGSLYFGPLLWYKEVNRTPLVISGTWPVGVFKLINHPIHKTCHHIFQTSLESNGSKVNRLSRRMLQSYKYMSLFYSFISNNTAPFDFCVRYYRNKYRSYCKCRDKSLWVLQHWGGGVERGGAD